MLHPAIILIAALPVIVRVVPFLIPGEYLEPYTFLNHASLNHVDGKEETKWMNMGYWDGTDDFAQANEALARRLLSFANVQPRSVLDIAHGPGESLSLHLTRTPPPARLDALTSRPSDTKLAQTLVSRHQTNTTVTFYTSSASYRAGKDNDHPLNPMKGFLGTKVSDGPPGYDLIYVLDGIYHFPPSLPHFLSSALKALSPGGTIAYTDILPPANLSALLRLILPAILSVPPRNLVADRGRPLSDYKDGLGKLGFEDVEIQDWSDNVWGGFASFLKSRGAGWSIVARGVEWAERNGWKFVAVKASRPA